MSSGKTEVVKDGFQAATLPKAKEDLPPENTTELTMSGGALLTGGNSRNASLTGGLRFLLLRDESQVTAAAAANYAQSAPTPDDSFDTTVENYQASVRYDYFITETTALFLGMSGRRDRFQGIDLRLNIDPGFAFYIERSQDMRLWAEGGYSFQQELRSEEAIQAADESGEPVASSERSHNTRFFAGYEQRLDDRLRFDAGVEYIRSISAPENWRLNYSAALSTTLSGRLSFAVSSGALYNNNPLPGVEKLDVTTALNLVYTLL